MSDILACQGVFGAGSTARLCGYLPQADRRERRGLKLYMTEKGGMCAECYTAYGNGKVVDRILLEARRDDRRISVRREEARECSELPNIPSPGPQGGAHFSGRGVYRLFAEQLDREKS